MFRFQPAVILGLATPDLPLAHLLSYNFFQNPTLFPHRVRMAPEGFFLLA